MSNHEINFSLNPERFRKIQAYQTISLEAEQTIEHLAQFYNASKEEVISNSIHTGAYLYDAAFKKAEIFLRRRSSYNSREIIPYPLMLPFADPFSHKIIYTSDVSIKYTSTPDAQLQVDRLAKIHEISQGHELSLLLIINAHLLFLQEAGAECVIDYDDGVLYRLGLNRPTSL